MKIYCATFSNGQAHVMAAESPRVASEAFNELGRALGAICHTIIGCETAPELLAEDLRGLPRATPEQVHQVSRDYRHDDNFNVMTGAPLMRDERGTHIQAWVLIEPADETEE